MNSALSGPSSRRAAVILFFTAAAFFTANISTLSLLPLDDCSYARKGVEMMQRGLSFTVTWNGVPTFQNPPLHFWILALSFRTFGEGDLAARLPSVIMALGIILMTIRIGAILRGTDVGLTGAALLLVTPLFLQNARRCMLEMPHAFWAVMMMWIYLEGRRHRKARLHLLLVFPLGAALLTKSLLGLLPLGVLVIDHLLDRRRPGRHLVIGVMAGLALGASWPIAEGLTYGSQALRLHYIGEIAAASSRGWSIAGFFFDFPRILVLEFQPVLLPGLAGMALALRDRPHPGSRRLDILSLWVIVALAACTVSGARSGRYIFPLLVPLALYAAIVLLRLSRRAALAVVHGVAPIVLVVGALVFWIHPAILTRDLDAPFKRSHDLIAALVPEGSSIPFLGSESWALYGPFLYYDHRMPGPVSESVDLVVNAARMSPRHVFMAEKARLDELARAGVKARSVLELREWTLLELVE